MMMDSQPSALDVFPVYDKPIGPGADDYLTDPDLCAPRCITLPRLTFKQLLSRQDRWSSPNFPEKSYILIKPGGWQDACHQINEYHLLEAD